MNINGNPAVARFVSQRLAQDYWKVPSRSLTVKCRASFSIALGLSPAPALLRNASTPTVADQNSDRQTQNDAESLSSAYPENPYAGNISATRAGDALNRSLPGAWCALHCMTLTRPNLEWGSLLFMLQVGHR
jgi:hypothetical protein